MRKIAIMGAGLAGTLLAIRLARRGYQVDLYERRPDVRGLRVDFGRSINLALSERGRHALSRVDGELLARVEVHGVPMRARAIHSSEGKLGYQPFGRHEEEYLTSLERHTLNIDLLNLAEEHPNLRLHFNQRLEDIDFKTMRLTLVDPVTQARQERDCESLVATDGVFSSARRLMVEHGLAKFVQAELDYGYKELPIPTEQARDMRRECLHLWPRRSFNMIANPNRDGSFGCSLFLPHEGSENSFAALKTPADVERFFRQHFPDAWERMPTVVEDFLSRPTGRLPTVRGGPWFFEDKVLMLGDAAHALTPFFAQGMNSAFEDCTVFCEYLDRFQDRWSEALPAFYEARRPHTDAIADMAMQNYREIQDLIADERFLLRKRVEGELMRRYPQRYTSMHVMVMFTRAPYAFAKECGELQDRLLRKVCADVSQVDQLHWPTVEVQLAGYADELTLLAGKHQVDLGRVDPARAGKVGAGA